MQLIKALGCIALVLLGERVQADNRLRIVAQSGAPAPGLHSDAIFEGFVRDSFGQDAAVINDFGQVAFRAFLVQGQGGVTAANDLGVWSEGSETMRLIAREGSMAAGTTGVFEFASDLNINEPGDTAFQGGLLVSIGGANSQNNLGIWTANEGNLNLKLREDSAILGGLLGPLSNLHFASLSLNNRGHIASRVIRVTQTGGNSQTESNVGIFSDRSGSMEAVVRAGEQAFGLPTGAAYDSFEYHPVLNDSGDIAFHADLKLGDGGITGLNDDVIYLFPADGTKKIIAQEGAAAPFRNGEYRFIGDLIDPSLNHEGQVAFHSRLTNRISGPPISNAFAIFVETNGTYRVVASSLDQPPGLPSGAAYMEMTPPLLNARGDAAFAASLRGSVTSDNNAGLWAEDNKSLRLIARKGAIAPGAGDGVLNTFSGIGEQMPVFNALGQIAFRGTLKLDIGGVSVNNNEGIWATDVDGILHLIARTGDQIDVDSGPTIDLRTIRLLAFTGDSGNQDGLSSGFNNKGQLAFVAHFTDRTSAVIVSNKVAIPEPVSRLLILICLAGVVSQVKSRCSR